LKASGDIAHIYNRGYILRDNNGNPVRMIGAMQDITERKRLEEQLLQKELDRQRQISKATIDTQERERAEIGRELHDNVNQVLTTTKLYLDLALSNTELKDSLLEKSEKNILYVIDEIRQLSRSLMNPSLGDLGLIASINDLLENIRATRKLAVLFTADKTIEDSLPDNLDLTIYRIIQEALNNTVKHANATTASVSIIKREQQLELTIHDNGIGFDPERVKPGSGLKNIENRVYLSNGSLHIRSAPGAGCTLTIQFTL
jgi:signal transduction histidine kinase